MEPGNIGGGSMSKYRVYELAKEFHTESKNVLKLLTQNGYEIKNTLSSVGEEERAVIQRLLGGKGQAGEKGAKPQAPAKPQAKPATQTAPNSHTPPAQRPGAKPLAQTKPLMMGTVRRIARGADIRAAKEAAERAEAEAKEAAARAAKEAEEAAKAAGRDLKKKSDGRTFIPMEGEGGQA